MKICLVDDYSVNMGDLSWDGLKPFGELVIHRSVAPHSDPIPLIGDCDVLIDSTLSITAQVMDACPHLKLIDIPATGYQCVDLDAARARGIAVCNAPGYSSSAVAQHIFALLLSLTNKVALHDQAVKAGEWCSAPSFCFLKAPISELDGKTFAVVGYGKIGQRALQIAQAFGMRTIAVAHHPETTKPMAGVTLVDAQTAFATADVIAMTCPLTPKTNKMVNASLLSLMKPSALLINTARGQLVDEDALADALNRGLLAGYAADVVSPEPMHPDCKLQTTPNTILTPHMAWCAKETRARLLDIVINNLSAWQRGERLNRVD